MPEHWTQWILVFSCVFVGSAIGGVSRFLVSDWISCRQKGGFPWRILVVNVTGSWGIGFVFGIIGENMGMVQGPPLWEMIAFGFLGGYTTFSTLSLQVLSLMKEKQNDLAVLYILMSVGLGLVAVLAGVEMGRGLV